MRILVEKVISMTEFYPFRGFALCKILYRQRAVKCRILRISLKDKTQTHGWEKTGVGGIT